MADMNEADIIEMFREVSTVLVGEEEEHKSLISAGDEFFSVKKKLASLEEEACERVRGELRRCISTRTEGLSQIEVDELVNLEANVG